MDNAVWAVQLAFACGISIYSAETGKPFWLAMICQLLFALVLHGTIALNAL